MGAGLAGVAILADLLAACGGGASASPAASAASPAAKPAAPSVQASASAKTAASSAPASASAKPAASSAPAASPAGKVTDVKVQLLWIEDVEFGGNFAVTKQGYDKAVGLKQTLIPGGPQLNAIQAVAGGAAPIGIIGGSDALIQARSNGIPVKAF
ncbi:MAG: ABC transporter substrate-binding protein, partial [Chloroflexota bacterium]